MTEDAGCARERGARWWLLPVLLWPVLLLLPCLTGARTFLPYDVAQFPPAAVLLPPGEVQRMRAESNWDVTEPPVWMVPELELARRTIVEDGALPSWNPAARTGTALLAHGHDGLWHPTVWVALLFPRVEDGLAFVALLHFLIAGALAFGLLRRLGLLPVAATLGGLAFAASSTLCANAHDYPRLASLIWLPGMLWALVAVARTAGSRAAPVAGFAACFALTWCAGFPPFAVPCVLVAACVALGLVIERWRAVGRGEALRLAGLYAAGAGLGALLAAPYLLPAYAFFGDSARTLAPDLGRIAQNRFETYGFLGYLAPDLFGRPDLVPRLPYDRSPLPLLLGDRAALDGTPLLPNFNATEYAVFPGTIVLWLAVAGAMRRRALLPLVVLVLLVLLATFQPGVRHLFELPGLRVAHPFRCLGPAALLVAWLAALGLDDVLRRRARWPVVTAACGALAAAAILGWAATRLAGPAVWQDWHVADRVARRFGVDAAMAREHLQLGAEHGAAATARELAAAATAAQAPLHLLAALLLPALLAAALRRPRLATGLAAAFVAATGIELWAAGRTFARGVTALRDDWTPVHEFLCSQRDASAATGGFMVARATRSQPPPPTALPPGTLQPLGIRDLQVYTFFDGRSIAPLGALLGPETTAKGYVAGWLPDDERLQHPLLDLLGVRFVLASQPLQGLGPPVGPELAGPGGAFFVYERPTALPRAFVVPRLAVLPADADVLAAITDRTFAPRQVAYTAAPLVPAGLEVPAAPEPAGGTGDTIAAGGRTVRFAVDRPAAVDLEVGAGAAGWLVLTDTAMAGWTASLDGQPLPIVTCDHSCRAVRVPDRACTVRFRYRVPGLAAGLGVALAAAAATLALLATAWRSRRHRRPVDTAT